MGCSGHRGQSRYGCYGRPPWDGGGPARGRCCKCHLPAIEREGEDGTSDSRREISPGRKLSLPHCVDARAGASPVEGVPLWSRTENFNALLSCQVLGISVSEQLDQATLRVGDLEQMTAGLRAEMCAQREAREKLEVSSSQTGGLFDCPTPDVE
mmetsp:Transcript_11181/g.32665  ORF Transcript_11181/g.32665 Transcript_11181/m.32665 type:complete len:154 (+) Transcript_11181:367-828(+)